jgi:drug/metabolite transporter (DMT)-like permease
MYMLALTSAALYGAADFLGGVASKSLSTTVVVAVSQATGLVVLLVAISLLPQADPSRSDLVYGVAAGLAGTVGVGLLYRALAIGVMGVVAPITAVCAVAIPVLFSVVRGARPGPLVVAGIALALVAIVLVSQQPAGPASNLPARRGLPPGVPHALASGVAIGVFFVVLSHARSEAGLWPLVGARSAALPLCVAASLVSGASFRGVANRTVRTAAAAGVLDMSANVLYLLASQMGSLPVAVTLSSLYPASTVVLARIFQGERLHRLQVVGMACALVAVACIVLGGAR